MPFYNCKYITDDGSVIKKVVFADSKSELTKSNANSNEKLISIRRNLFKGITYIDLFKKKIKYTEFLLFNQKLITLLKSGVPFIRAMEIILSNTDKGNFKEILKKVYHNIKNGVQISDAFISNQLPFINIYRATLLAGEKSGNLEVLLEKFNVYLEKISNLKKKVFSSLAYPVILLVFMFLMLFLILVFAIPKFEEFYSGFNADLPKMTGILIGFSVWLKNNILIIILFFLLIYFFLKILEKRFGFIIFDKMITKIPYIGKIVEENSLSVFSRTLAILISGGIPVPESTEIAINTFSNRYMFKNIESIPDKIREGMLLSQTLENVKFVPGIMVEIIRVGETSGSLVEVLEKNGDYYENTINTKINSLISLIEPIMIMILGLVIAFMLISIYLPIFNLVNVVDNVGKFGG